MARALSFFPVFFEVMVSMMALVFECQCYHVIASFNNQVIFAVANRRGIGRRPSPAKGLVRQSGDIWTRKIQTGHDFVADFRHFLWLF